MDATQLYIKSLAHTGFPSSHHSGTPAVPIEVGKVLKSLGVVYARNLSIGSGEHLLPFGSRTHVTWQIGGGIDGSLTLWDAESGPELSVLVRLSEGQRPSSAENVMRQYGFEKRY